jgi:hypothetical protein
MYDLEDETVRLENGERRALYRDQLAMFERQLI